MRDDIIFSIASGLISFISGAHLLDRDPKYFGPLLNYLRTGKLFVDAGVSLDGIREEARFFQVTCLTKCYLSDLFSQKGAIAD